eukprot:TRINITY_DN48261_c0_g1_i1.p1 TRINITY_DN48261_c0_g1~~TRINITY_DN48261_c0_g1_i1.p1  ORF type:complete len:195 (-),score=21.90 TRINITY_DN48261_c0_g1_i1:88-672(-)
MQARHALDVAVTSFGPVGLSPMPSVAAFEYLWQSISEIASIDFWTSGEDEQTANDQWSNYDPDTDDYDVRTTATISSRAEDIEDMVWKQIVALERRVESGGAPDVVDHYRKVIQELKQSLPVPPEKQNSMGLMRRPSAPSVKSAMHNSASTCSLDSLASTATSATTAFTHLAPRRGRQGTAPSGSLRPSSLSQF